MDGSGSPRLRQRISSGSIPMLISTRRSTGGPGTFRLGVRAPIAPVPRPRVVGTLAPARGLAVGGSCQRLRNLSPKRSQRYRFIEQYSAILAGLSSRPHVTEGRDENDGDVELGVPQELQDRETA